MPGSGDPQSAGQPARAASAAAMRQRRRRWRQKLGLVRISIALDPEDVDNLVRLGRLRGADRGDKEALTTAVVGIAGQAIKRGVTL
jgi:hypothetical protein